MERCYLIRYGLMGNVGSFPADGDAKYERGERVVIRSHRGVELGEVLIELPERYHSSTFSSNSQVTSILRLASSEDHARARDAEAERVERLNLCQRIFTEGTWPFEIIDCEPLLEKGRTVLHYLGKHNLDMAGILASVRTACDLDVMFEPVGPDVRDEFEDEEALEPVGHSCGTCQSGGGEGGCGTEEGGCGSSQGGCGDCGVKKLIAARH